MKNLVLALALFAGAQSMAQTVTSIRCVSDTGRTVVTAYPSGPWYLLTVVQDGGRYLHNNVATVGNFNWREIYPPQLASGSLTGRTTGSLYLSISSPGETDYVFYEKINELGYLQRYQTAVVCTVYTN